MANQRILAPSATCDHELEAEAAAYDASKSADLSVLYGGGEIVEGALRRARSLSPGRRAARLAGT